MFFKKRDKVKKRVVCPIPVIVELIQKLYDDNCGMCEFDMRLENSNSIYKVGFTSDFDRKRGFFDPIFFLDEQKFTAIEDFMAQARLNGEIFSQMADVVEVVDVDGGQGLVKFPWYVKFEDYVVE